MFKVYRIPRSEVRSARAAQELNAGWGRILIKLLSLDRRKQKPDQNCDYSYRTYKHVDFLLMYYEFQLLMLINRPFPPNINDERAESFLH